MEQKFSSEDVEHKVLAILEKMFDVPADQLTPQTKLVYCDREELFEISQEEPDGLLVVDPDMAELAMELEETLDITIPIGELDAVRTVGDIVELVKRRLGARLSS